MTPAPTLQELIDGVRADAPEADALGLLSEAARTVGELDQVTDALLGHFVDQCRRSGRSWSEISKAIGVSKQAAHKRFTQGAPTFERFTPRARAVLSGSEDEAKRLGHGFVGTEHLLLALFEDPASLAARALEGAGINKAMVQERVLELVIRGTDSGDQKRPFTPRAKEVLHRAVIEALQLGHNYIGTEHLLLGLFDVTHAVASKVLIELGSDYVTMSSTLVQLLAEYKKA
jgi:hypothetical protein